MPFDYNSFFKGVQTGLRLGRTSPGRQPRPPAPPGVYILTEDKEIVFTEFAGTATTYDVGAEYWYPATVTQWSPYPFENPTELSIRHDEWIETPYLKYLYWWDTESTREDLALHLVVYLPKSRYSPDYLGLYGMSYLHDYNIPSMWAAFNNSSFLESGAFLYNIVESAAFRWIMIDGMVSYVGTRAQLLAYLDSVLPMITEGGE